MKRNILFSLVAAATIAATLPAVADEAEAPSVYDNVWSYLTFIDNDEAAVVQKLAVVGRLQGDAYSFQSEDSSNEDIAWRRFRLGLKTTMFQDFIIHAEMDGNMNEADSGDWDAFYIRLTDAYVKWSPSKKASVKVGKQSAGFTLDGATSSKKLIVPERNIVAGNLWFGTEYFTGASVGGDINDWSYNVGGFSASEEAEFGHFDNGYFGLFSAARKVGNGKLRMDYVYSDAQDSTDWGDHGANNMEHTVALVHTIKLNDKTGIMSDIAYGMGRDDNGDLFGGSVKPYYDLTDSLQLVMEYAGVTSLDNESVVNMSRYAGRNTPTGVSRNRAETSHNLLAGFNWYLYGHKLKWQNAVEYNYGKNLASTGEDYNGYGVTSALRISW